MSYHGKNLPAVRSDDAVAISMRLYLALRRRTETIAEIKVRMQHAVLLGHVVETEE